MGFGDAPGCTAASCIPPPAAAWIAPTDTGQPQRLHSPFAPHSLWKETFFLTLLAQPRLLNRNICGV